MRRRLIFQCIKFATATTTNFSSRPAQGRRHILCHPPSITLSRPLREHRGIRSLCPRFPQHCPDGGIPLAPTTTRPRDGDTFVQEHLLPSSEVRLIETSRPTPWAIALRVSALVAATRLTRYVRPQEFEHPAPEKQRKQLADMTLAQEGDTQPLSADSTNINYGSFDRQHMTTHEDPQEVQREIEALQRVVARTSVYTPLLHNPPPPISPPRAHGLGTDQG